MTNILYVDDEADLLEIGKLFLEDGSDFVVDTTVNPTEVVNRIKKNGYEAIISDYQMPGMNGIGLLKAVRAEFPNLPFILFTGRGREEVMLEAIEHGVTLYVQKGGDPLCQFAELRQKVNISIGKEREKQKSRRRYKTASNRLLSIIGNDEGNIAEIIREALDIVGAQAGYIALVENEELRIRESYGLNKKEFKEMVVHKGSGMGWKVVDSQKVMIVNNYQKSTAINHEEKVDQAVAAEGIFSAVAVPIFLPEEKEKCGVFYAFSRESDFKFDEDDSELLLMSANFIAMEIKKERNRSEKVKAKAEKERIEKKIALMSDITLHGIKNNVTVIIGALSLLLDVVREERVREPLMMIQRAADKMVKEIRNLENYQNLGTSNPQKYSVDSLVSHYSEAFPSLTFVNKTMGLEVYADPALATVIEIFIDNTLTHGVNATQIILRNDPPLPDGRLIFTVEDNGVGVPDEKKSKIFERFQSTFSLFYVKEFLANAGMEIREVGKFGQGACFEITIPKGLYKLIK